MFSLEGKTALVTGAGFGMGAGVARAFARQGAHVIVNDLESARAEEVVAPLWNKVLRQPLHLLT